MALYKGDQALTDIEHVEGLQAALDAGLAATTAGDLSVRADRQFFQWRWSTDAERNAQTGMRHGDLGWMSDRRAFRYSGTAWVLTDLPETTFSPGIVGGVTVGNGANTATVSVHAGLATMSHKVFLGSTSVVGGAPRFNLPYPSPTARYVVGRGRFYDYSADVFYDVQAIIIGSVVFLYPVIASTGYATLGGVTGATPFTWAGGDYMEYTVSWALEGVGV